MSRKTLDGWDEIGNHFRVTGRTAQEWEKTGNLPVHRKAGTKKKPRVYAYPDELDEWQRSHPKPKRLPKRPVPKSKRTRAIVLAGLIIAFFAAIAWNATRHGPPAAWQVTGNTLEVLDESGRRCWTMEFPDLAQEYYHGHLAKRHGLLTSIDNDDQAELLFSYAPAGIRRTTSGTLHAYDHDGQELWTLPYGRDKKYGERSFSPYYESRVIQIAKAKGETYIILSISHKRFPTQVLLINPANGEVMEDYWHPGHLEAYAVADLDGDGDDEILLGGSNNPGNGIGHAGIVQLEVPFKDNARSLPAHFPVGYTGGAATRYFLFPNIDLTKALGLVPTVHEILVNKEGFGIEILAANGRIQYQLDKDFEFTGVWPSDNVSMQRRQLQLQGKLPPGPPPNLHQILELPATPDANHSETEKLLQNLEKPISHTR